MRVRAAVLACLLAGFVALSGCGNEGGTGAEPTSKPHVTAVPAVVEDPSRPPEIVIADADSDAKVTPQPGSYCWHTDTVGVCADSAGPNMAIMPVLETAGPVAFEFPITGWKFTVTFTDFPDTSLAEGAKTTRLEQPVPGRFAITAPPGPGDFVVTLFGDGPQGDTQAWFRWRVSSDD